MKTSLIDSTESDELLGNKNEEGTINLDRLLHLGLTKDEAKAWLKNEPSYKPSDESKQSNHPTKRYQNPIS